MRKHITNFLCPPLAASALVCAFLLAGLGGGNAQSQSAQITNASPQIVKAYKTLNFGDDTKTVEHKLAEIVGGPVGLATGSPVPIQYSEIIQGSLFDTGAEYESQPNELNSLMSYLSEKVGVEEISCKNSAISVNCYQLNKSWNPERNGDLGIVEVSYITFDLDKLVEGFMQNYPNARKEKRAHRVESEKYRGIFLEFERAYLSDINPDRRAKLSIPTGKFTFTFTEPSKLSKEQLAVWEALMAADGKTSKIEEYFESVKTSLLELAKNMEVEKKIDDYSLVLLGWPGKFQYGSHKSYGSIIYGAPSAVFASKQILDSHMKNYRESTEAADQKKKAKLKKESESSTSF
jgi:hypothetical protein